MTDVKINVAATLSGQNPIKELVGSYRDYEQVARRVSTLGDKAVAQEREIVAAMNRRFEHLKRIDRTLRQNLKITGQQDLGFDEIDWFSAYGSQKAARIHRARSFQYMTGAPMPEEEGAGGAARMGGGYWGGIPGGSTFKGILKGGMAIAGIGSVMGVVSTAITQQLGLYKELEPLYRRLHTLPDTFKTLQDSVSDTAHKIYETAPETAKLMGVFAREARVADWQDARNAVGGVGRFAIGYGMDKGEAAGLFGMSKRFGLYGTGPDRRSMTDFAAMVGRAVGDSETSMNMEELMQAMVRYAEQNARATTTGAAGVETWLSMYSAMQKSREPGVSGQLGGSLLQQYAAGFSAGGNEAMQFLNLRIFGKEGWGKMWYRLAAGPFASDKDMGFGESAEPYGLTQYHGILKELGAYGNFDEYTINKLLANAWGLAKPQDAEAIKKYLQMTKDKGPEYEEFQSFVRQFGDGSGQIDNALIPQLYRLFSANSENSIRVMTEEFMRRVDVSGEEKKRLREAPLSEQKNMMADMLRRHGPEVTPALAYMKSTNELLESIRTSMGNDLIGAITRIKEIMEGMFGWVTTAKENGLTGGGMTDPKVREKLREKYGYGKRPSDAELQKHGWDRTDAPPDVEPGFDSIKIPAKKMSWRPGDAVPYQKAFFPFFNQHGNGQASIKSPMQMLQTLPPFAPGNAMGIDASNPISMFRSIMPSMRMLNAMEQFFFPGSVSARSGGGGLTAREMVAAVADGVAMGMSKVALRGVLYDRTGKEVGEVYAAVPEPSGGVAL